VRDRRDALVLCYHAVSPTWPAALSVTPERLATQLHHLVARGYCGATFSQIVRGEAPSKAVAITFDDGYRSVHRLARPILDEFGMLATLFVPTDFIGSEEPMAWPGIDRWLGGEHERELIPMSWDEVRELRDAGWEIGSHTKSHPKLTQVSDAELVEQLAGSRLECEHQLGACDSIAFPYGDHDDRVVEAAAAAGYTAAATLPADYPRPTPLRWPRIGIYHADNGSSFRLKASPVVRKLRGSRLWPAAMRALGRGDFSHAD
jgi:peptidoglycan/xylan/chitin deacetylase (PgdA/CDA1 family)